MRSDNKKNHLLTTKQRIKRDKIRAGFIIAAFSILIITMSGILSFESNRVNTYHSDSLAEERAANNGKTAVDTLTSYIKFGFQELETYRSMLDKITPYDLNTEEKIIDSTNKMDIDSFLQDMGLLYNGNIYFHDNVKIPTTAFESAIKGNYIYSGEKINPEDDAYIYFAIPTCEEHQSIQGIIGRITKNKLALPMMPKTHEGQDSILLVDQDYNIMLLASPQNEWRFVGSNNYTELMRSWVDDEDFAKYTEFINDPTISILNVGKNDRNGMIYRQEVGYSENGIHYVIFMAPKATLTQTMESLSLSILIILYIVLVLFLLVSISGIIIIFKQKENAIINNAFSSVTNLNKDESFYRDSAALVYNNKKKTPYSLIYVNIKELRKINERYGAQFGEKLIAALGIKIEQTITKDVEIACYQRGGYFLVLVEGNKEDAVYKATTLNNILRNISEYDYLNLSFSFGIKELTDSYININEEAEKARFAEKNNTSDDILCIYDEKMDTLRKENQDLIDEFDDAIKNNEFEIYLQLKWDLNKNDWAGAETLVRWNHHKKGLISPGKFIPIFEENGYITRLDVYVFEKTCQLLRQMIDNGERIVPVSINLSKRHFTHQSLSDEYEEIVNKYQIPHDLIEFEITEGLLMDNVDVYTRFIKIFHENDYFIAMDDFGAGYSSLNMIHELDFDVIKIDAKFFRAGLDESNKTIIESIINLCHKLNKVVVAEGIELESEVEFLKTVGCDIIQGYYFAKPVPANDFRQKLADSKKNE